MDLKIILVRPQHAGNLGSVARAMANMGLRGLRLVAPQADPADLEAIKMAMGGGEVLKQSQNYSNLEEAIVDLKLIVGTSRHRGKERDNYISARDFADSTLRLPRDHPVGVVFGTEDKGLTKEELTYCQKLLHIPSHRDCPSLNLAQAVMVVAYEIFIASLKDQAVQEDSLEREVATLKDLEAMVGDWRQLLYESGFLDRENPDHMMRSLRNLFNRARLTHREVKIFRGICRQIRWWKEEGP